MLRKIFVFLILLFTMVGCVDIRDPETLTLELNPGIDTVDINSEFTDAGAYATLEGKSRPVEITADNVDISQVGTYEITYQTSFGDIVLEITRYVDVIDETSPSISLNPGVDTITLGTVWEDAGITVTDNSELDVTINHTGQVSSSQIGEYQITYTATDAYGNESTIIRYVHVVEE
jgi:hypothetical protein